MFGFVTCYEPSSVGNYSSFFLEDEDVLVFCGLCSPACFWIYTLDTLWVHAEIIIVDILNVFLFRCVRIPVCVRIHVKRL